MGDAAEGDGVDTDEAMAERCTVCTRRADDHTGVHHMFASPGTRVETSQFGPRRRERQPINPRDQMPVSVIQTPFDPVLRQVLLNKGIISTVDLLEAEQMIQAVTNQITTDKDIPQ